MTGLTDYDHAKDDRLADEAHDRALAEFRKDFGDCSDDHLWVRMAAIHFASMAAIDGPSVVEIRKAARDVMRKRGLIR